jgi:hypothetical protein
VPQLELTAGAIAIRRFVRESEGEHAGVSCTLRCASAGMIFGVSLLRMVRRRGYGG